MSFSILTKDSRSLARRGELRTAHGSIQTPVFMPVGTQGTVKAMSNLELEELGAEIILGNTYHLSLRPGAELIEQAGGLHGFMNWQRPILTDSGGYQVFSLGKMGKKTEEGMHFQSHLDGSHLFIGPVEAMRVQRQLASDIAMVFDECTAWPATHAEAKSSLQTTLRWAVQCSEQERAHGQLVFGIVQGGVYADLRSDAIKAISDMQFDGIAVGGVSVGEPESVMIEVLDICADLLPKQVPHYLMGVGTPRQLVSGILRGIDMFDCVLPTRMARNGSAYTPTGTIPVKAARYKDDFTPIQEDCACYACQNHSKAYIRHLLHSGEILGARLMSIHNLHFYIDLMRQCRKHLEEGSFYEFAQNVIELYPEAEGKLKES
ncbi:MAG: tRNA guanosine(34) transglycosylase Tgt [Oligosphaeraceae bacterium]|nr:tRNA guanosine(34) transglycosylase Tgt [Oligosphaeraceae bacterium]